MRLTFLYSYIPVYLNASVLCTSVAKPLFSRCSLWQSFFFKRTQFNAQTLIRKVLNGISNPIVNPKQTQLNLCNSVKPALPQFSEGGSAVPTFLSPWVLVFVGSFFIIVRLWSSFGASPAVCWRLFWSLRRLPVALCRPENTLFSPKTLKFPKVPQFFCFRIGLPGGKWL